MAKLDAAERDSLADSDYAYIDSKGGRHLPIQDAAHTRNALARFGQTDFESDSAKSKAKAKIMAAARKFGIETQSGSKADEGANNLRNILQAALSEGRGKGLWISDVYSDFIVYCDETQRTWKCSYTLDGDAATLGTPEEVIVQMTYEPVSSAKAETDDISFENFTLDFAMKSTQEVTVDGQVGLLGKGYASLFGVRDADGEHQVKGSFDDINDTWGNEKEPIIMFHHGLDNALTTRRIGKATKWLVDHKGLYVEFFIPKVPSFKDAKALTRFNQIYQGIRAGKINGLSVGGVVMKLGKALLKWSMSEMTVTPGPSLADARFVLGAKALKAIYGEVPPALMGGDASGTGTGGTLVSPEHGQMHQAPGMVNREHFTAIMKHAQADGDAALHDHLLSRPPEHHGEHIAEKCAVCAGRRAMNGIKAAKIDDGDWVAWDIQGQTFQGQVVGVYKTKVPGTANALYGTEETPAARIRWYDKKNGVLKPSDLHVAAHLTNLTKIAPPEMPTFYGEMEPDVGNIEPEVDAPSRDARKSDIAAALESNPDLLATTKALLARVAADNKAGKKHSRATVEKVKKVMTSLKDLHQHLADEFIQPDGQMNADSVQM